MTRRESRHARVAAPPARLTFTRRAICGAPVLVAATLVLAACSSSNPSTRPASSTTSTSAPAVTTTSVTATAQPRSSTTETSPVPQATRCRTNELTASLGPGGGAAGNGGSVLTLTNHSTRTCSVYGYVGLRLVDANRRFLPTTVSRQGSMLFKDRGPISIALRPGESAHAGIGYGDNPSGTESYAAQCPSATFLEVTPPDETDYVLIDAHKIRPCAHGNLDVTALQRNAFFSR